MITHIKNYLISEQKIEKLLLHIKFCVDASSCASCTEMKYAKKKRYWVTQWSTRFCYYKEMHDFWKQRKLQLYCCIIDIMIVFLI